MNLKRLLATLHSLLLPHDDAFKYHAFEVTVGSTVTSVYVIKRRFANYCIVSLFDPKPKPAKGSTRFKKLFLLLIPK